MKRHHKKMNGIVDFVELQVKVERNSNIMEKKKKKKRKRNVERKRYSEFQGYRS